MSDEPNICVPAARHPREGWEEAARAIAETGDDDLIWPEFANADDDKLIW